MDYTPLYIKIKEYILEKIDKGILKPGDRIPSESKLSEIFKVSRITVNTAIRDLANNGIVYRIRGKGTFVADSHSEEELNIFLQSPFKDKFRGPFKKSEHKTIDISKIKPPRNVYKKMNLSADDKVYKVVRLRMVDNETFALEYIYLPEKICPEDSLNSLGEQYMHEFLQKQCNIVLNRARIYVDAAIVNQFESELLGTEKKSPILLWEVVTYTDEGKIVEFSQNLIKSGKYRYYLEFNI